MNVQTIVESQQKLTTLFTEKVANEIFDTHGKLIYNKLWLAQSKKDWSIFLARIKGGFYVVYLDKLLKWSEEQLK